MRILVLCLFALSLAACERNRDWFEAAVAERHKAGRKTVRLGDLTEFKWERMCYYSPYAKSAALGIDNTEQQWVLVFYLGDEVVERAEGRRRKLEIVLTGSASATAPCFAPDRIAKLHGKRGIPHLTLAGAIK